MTPLCDAHNHLHDSRLLEELPEIVSTMEKSGITHCVVNGTCEADWDRVWKLNRTYPRMALPSIGLHPWNLPSRSANWLKRLTSIVTRDPGRVFIGECGLDRWMRNPDLEEQQRAFISQLSLATEYNLPISIHCLKAWGPLMETLTRNGRPDRGFLLHSYGGSPELVPELVKLGAYFSFSGYFLREDKEKIHEAFRRVPSDRIMVETDAPDMLPPENYRKHALKHTGNRDLNHPANLSGVVQGLAKVIDIEELRLRTLLARNFYSFFPIGHS